MQNMKTDYIPMEAAKTLSGLFRLRIERSADTVALHHYERANQTWAKVTWNEMGRQVARWQAALEKEKLERGDRVAIMCRNCPHWVYVDQAVLGLGLVIVPLYVSDRAENVAYILADAGVKVLVIEGKEQWQQLEPLAAAFKVQRIVCINACPANDKRMVAADDWLPAEGGALRAKERGANDLASIVYTSGTTGNPKGVMLSHNNMLSNAWASSQALQVYPSDLMLSFLPLSHMFERTAGYYLTLLAGNQVAYARSVQDLPDDLMFHKPTVLISVPRIFERVYSRITATIQTKSAVQRFLFNKTKQIGWHRFEFLQGRAGWSPSLWLWPLLSKLVAHKVLERLGGRIRIAIAGGAPLSFNVAELFLGMGLNIIQGYGLTETSPVLTANRVNHNDPRSVGLPVEGVELSIGDNDELLARGPGIMLGYWNNEKATKDAIDGNGWFHTGDKARFDHGNVYITGRIKEILVLANGEKVPPADMEMAITSDPLFDQVMVIGEAKPYLSALVVLNGEEWKKLAKQLGVEADSAQARNQNKVFAELLKHIGETTKIFPGYAQIRRVAVCAEPWNIDNGLMTPTLKLKRNRILEQYKAEVDALYEGH